MPVSAPLTERVALVTGASSGIGRAIALTLADAGATVVCCDLRSSARPEGYEPDIAIDTHDLIVQRGGRATFVCADVTDSDQVRAAVDHAVDVAGDLDIMVNNAGIWTGAHTILDETIEQFERTIDVNLRGTWLGAKYALASFVARDTPGRIINIASMAGLVGLAEEPAYCASKGGVVALTRQLALDFGPRGIATNAICPGFISTALGRSAMGVNPEHALTPWPRLGTVEDVAGAALYLASASADFVNGTILTVDAGYTAR
jgi:NAD(P)-dependent dehydrogenase (short-subunit alcohol dehydrogenase family)